MKKRQFWKEEKYNLIDTAKIKLEIKPMKQS